MDTTGKEYFYHLDMMKGIAIVLVVIGHVMLFTFDINPSEPSKFIYFNMPLFFYISGFLAYRETDSLKEMGEKVFHRGLILLVPYLMFLPLYNIFAGNADNILSLIIGGGQRYWFLYYLFILSTFFIIYGYTIRSVHSTWLYVILWLLPLVTLIIAKTVLLRQGYADGDAYANISRLLNYYRYFLIGFLCRKYASFNRLLFKNSYIFAIGFVFYFLNWYFFEMHNMFLIFFGTLGAIIVLQNWIQQSVAPLSAVGRLLIYVGRCSLGIYVIHYFFIPSFPENVHRILCIGNPFIWQLTMAVLIAVPIVTASIFVYKMISMNRWLYLSFFGKIYKK